MTTVSNAFVNLGVDDDKEEEEEDDDDDEAFFVEAQLPSIELPLDRGQVEALTVPQLKQQLRLRGLKVSGRKVELVNRLLQSTGATLDTDAAHGVNENEVVSSSSSSSSSSKKSKARAFAAQQGKTLIDVTAYLDQDDVGKEVRSSSSSSSSSSASSQEEVVDDDDKDNPESANPEVWGSQARIVDDYEGRRVVVDSISETLIEFLGSNQTYQQALVVATRDALRPFLTGGTANNETQTPAEERLRELQLRREQAARRPVQFEDTSGLDEGDETGIYSNILDRDFSDWGKYTQTGAQLSKSEVQGVLLLSDVFGIFSEDTKALAEKIAFECQPVVVFVPDLFKGNPWTGSTDDKNEKGQTYEEWRATHSDLQVSVNIRAAAACLRNRYGVSSVVVWGTCYGGGRALEAASGWLPGGNIHDIDGNLAPPLVDPMAVIAWYPTRYNAKQLFGREHKGSTVSLSGEKRKLAVMAVFAGKDQIPGATPESAAELKSHLEQDERVIDHMVKVFPDQDHGFAHIGMSDRLGDATDETERFLEDEFGGAGRLSFAEGDAEVACLLSTAFMETYSRVFLPTVGPPISLDESESAWGKELDMRRLDEANSRDVRKELEEAADSFVEEPLGGYRIDPTDESQEEELAKLLRTMQDPDMEDGPYKIQPDDDLTTIYAKLTSSDENFQIF